MNGENSYVFIFDLDNTLVNTDAIKINYNIQEGGQLFNNPYESIKADIKLQFLLSKINNKKIIFSNATQSHVENVINALGIKRYIGNIVDRTLTRTLKPNLNSYIITMQLAGIRDLKKCIFFDDLVPNLITAKYIGWKTVLIGSKYIHPCIDYSFNNIHEALIFFLKNSN